MITGKKPFGHGKKAEDFLRSYQELLPPKKAPKYDDIWPENKSKCPESRKILKVGCDYVWQRLCARCLLAGVIVQETIQKCFAEDVTIEAVSEILNVA